MISLLILVLAVGLATGLAWLMRKTTRLEKEKATWGSSQAASDARVKALEELSFKYEQEQRAKEDIHREPEDDLERTDVWFYPPGVRRDDPPN